MEFTRRPQNMFRWHEQIRQEYLQARAADPDRFARRIDLSWSNWGFGLEDLAVGAARLSDNGVEYIELHGNHYGPDLGYRVDEARKVLSDHGLKTSGVCGMFSEDNDLSSNRPHQRQAAIDYIRREAEFTRAMGGEYLLVVPGAVGRPVAYDAFEFERSVETLSSIADVLVETGVKAAIEPIRSAEVSFIHTVDDAVRYIEAVGHPGVQHINGDVYHMQSEEPYVAAAVRAAGDRLVNLHLADSNRRALGHGSMDLDAIIMALYLIGANQPGRFATPEPLGPGGSPYPARNGVTDPAVLDALVRDTVSYFRDREDAVRGMEE